MFNPFTKVFDLYRDERTRRMDERMDVRRRVVSRDTYEAAQKIIAEFRAQAPAAAFESGINATIAGETETADFLFGVSHYLTDIEEHSDADQYLIKEAGEGGPVYPGFANRSLDDLRMHLYAMVHMPEIEFGIPFEGPEREAYDEKWRIFEENKPRPSEPQEK